jgi:hypothetical protein
MKMQKEVKIALMLYLLLLIPAGYGIYLNSIGKPSWVALFFTLLLFIPAVYFTWKANKKVK